MCLVFFSLWRHVESLRQYTYTGKSIPRLYSVKSYSLCLFRVGDDLRARVASNFSIVFVNSSSLAVCVFVMWEL